MCESIRHSFFHALLINFLHLLLLAPNCSIIHLVSIEEFAKNEREIKSFVHDLWIPSLICRFYDAGLIKMYFEILVFVASLQTLALSATISTSYSSNEISNEAGALTCTSEREVCLPANYSKFQLPNKGKQTVVSIGEHVYSSGGLHNRPQFSAHSSKLLRLSAFHLSRIYGHFYGVNFGK